MMMITEPYLHIRYEGTDCALMCSLSVCLWMEGIILLPSHTCTFAMKARTVLWCVAR